MLTDEQIAEIAGKLTGAQKRAICDGYAKSCSTVSALIDKKLTLTILRYGFGWNVFLNETGLAVRNHLENSRGTD